jgi:hypothetical protein
VAGRLHAYRVELDGKAMGKIGSGERTDLAVVPGHHRLPTRASWTGSQILSFEIKKGALAHFECQPDGHSPTALNDRVKPLRKQGHPWVDLRELTGEDIDGT